jgi:hypothetical protein
METSKDKKAGPKRIGELLVAANVVKTDVLLEALQISKASKCPIGRTLMSMGYLSEPDLQAAIELQSLLRAGLISTEFGVRALNVAVKSRVPLEEAFAKLGWRPPMHDVLAVSELGELLFEAGLIKRKELETAMAQSKAKGLPLGRCLTLNHVITMNLLSSALTAQVLLRDGKITREQAVAGLKASAKKQQTMEESLEEVGAYAADENQVKLGELLAAARLVSESDKVAAVEVGLERKQPVGKVLVESGVIPQRVLDDCLKLQKLVSNGSLTLSEAAEALKQSQLKHLSVDRIMDERASKALEITKANLVVPLLTAAKVFTEQEIDDATKNNTKANASIGEILIDARLIDKAMLEAAVHAKNLLEDGVIHQDHAVAALLHCKRTGAPLHRALEEIGWMGPEDAGSAKPQANSDANWFDNMWSKVKRKD